jgi:hypothetical protein
LKANSGYLEPTVEHLLKLQVEESGQEKERSTLDTLDEPTPDVPPDEQSHEIDASEEIAQYMQYEYLDELSFQEQLETIIKQTNEETKTVP